MRRKKGSGSRDIGMSSNGKGSANRTSDNAAFAENYEAIDWGHGGPGEIRYPYNYLDRGPLIPDGWRKLEPAELRQRGDYWEYFSGEPGELWQPVRHDFNELVGVPLVLIRKLKGSISQIFPAEDVTDIAQQNPT